MLVAERGQTSLSLVSRDHSCGLAVGQDGMAHGCLSSLSKERAPLGGGRQSGAAVGTSPPLNRKYSE